MRKLKDFNSFLNGEKINEGVVHNIVLSALISLGSISSYSSIHGDIKNKIVQKSAETPDILNVLKFLELNNLKLEKKYNLLKVKEMYERDYNTDFSLVLPKLTPKYSPISASVFTFDLPTMGLVNIPLAEVKFDIGKNFQISLWDSGWSKPGNMIGIGINKKF